MIALVEILIIVAIEMIAMVVAVVAVLIVTAMIIVLAMLKIMVITVRMVLGSGVALAAAGMKTRRTWNTEQSIRTMSTRQQPAHHVDEEVLVVWARNLLLTAGAMSIMLPCL